MLSTWLMTVDNDLAWSRYLPKVMFAKFPHYKVFFLKILCKYGLKDIYSILWIIIWYNLILFLKLFKLWPLELFHLTLMPCDIPPSMWYFFSKLIFVWTLAQAPPGVSKPRLIPIVGVPGASLSMSAYQVRATKSWVLPALGSMRLHKPAGL